MDTWQVKFKAIAVDGEVYTMDEGWEPFGATSTGVWLKRHRASPVRMLRPRDAIAGPYVHGDPAA